MSPIIKEPKKDKIFSESYKESKQSKTKGGSMNSFINARVEYNVFPSLKKTKAYNLYKKYLSGKICFADLVKNRKAHEVWGYNSFSQKKLTGKVWNFYGFSLSKTYGFTSGSQLTFKRFKTSDYNIVPEKKESEPSITDLVLNIKKLSDELLSNKLKRGV